MWGNTVRGRTQKGSSQSTTAIYKGGSNILPSSQDYVGKLSTLKEKRAKVQGCLNFFTQKALYCWMMKVSNKAQIISLSYNQVYLKKQALF